ncbi:MAG: RNA polymerase sigma factor [Bacteroidota bacterium]
MKELLTESELVEGCLKGMKKAQTQLFQRYAGKLLVVCIRYVQVRDDAEDVLQEGFIKIFKNLDTFKNTHEGSLFFWMRRIMVNLSLNFLRDTRKYRFTEDIEPMMEIVDNSDENDSENNLMYETDQAVIRQIIFDLPLGYKTIFNLYAMEGYTHPEIASMLGISQNTSKTQLMKARRMIRSKLEVNATKENLIRNVI